MDLEEWFRWSDIQRPVHRQVKAAVRTETASAFRGQISVGCNCIIWIQEQLFGLCL